MHLTFFPPAGWEDCDIEHQPAIRRDMPVLIDDDLRFDDDGGPRAAVAANLWLRERPISGAPAANSWEVYARALKGWMEFVADRGIPVFGTYEQLRTGLGLYAEHRLAGPMSVRVSESTWNLYVVVLSMFYDWAVHEDHATAVPFTYVSAKRIVDGQLINIRRNLAKVRK